MKCLHCQGTMKKGLTPLHVDRKGCHLTLDKVSAWICSQCGEVYFEENEVNAVQDLLRAIDQKAEIICAVA